jgi:hypothetical protein
MDCKKIHSYQIGNLLSNKSNRISKVKVATSSSKVPSSIDELEAKAWAETIKRWEQVMAQCDLEDKWERMKKMSNQI